MKICAVQLESVRGDVAASVAKHLAFIEVAAAHGADLVFFPELSLTGYEPTLAKALAMRISDARLDVFQACSEQNTLIIGVGLPLALGDQVQIGMAWFTPNAPRQTYAKQKLHADEMPFFVAGERQCLLETSAHTFAPAICYESLLPIHSQRAAERGADIYLASVAKPAGGMAKAMAHYPAVARQHGMYVVMADAVGPSDDFVSVGQSAAWNDRGELLMQMDRESEGFLRVDSANGRASVHPGPSG